MQLIFINNFHHALHFMFQKCKILLLEARGFVGGFHGNGMIVTVSNISKAKNVGNIQENYTIK